MTNVVLEVVGKSKTINHLVFQKFLLDAFVSRSQVDVIYTKFTFNKVNYIILISKLGNNVICDPFIFRISSYVPNREKIVQYKNCKSNPVSVTSSVRQGSHLDPLLFLLFINDLNVLYSSKLLFDDDLKLFQQIKSI